MSPRHLVLISLLIGCGRTEVWKGTTDVVVTPDTRCGWQTQTVSPEARRITAWGGGLYFHGWLMEELRRGPTEAFRLDQCGGRPERMEGGISEYARHGPTLGWRIEDRVVFDDGGFVTAGPLSGELRFDAQSIFGLEERAVVAVSRATGERRRLFEEETEFQPEVLGQDEEYLYHATDDWIWRSKKRGSEPAERLFERGRTAQEHTDGVPWPLVWRFASPKLWIRCDCERGYDCAHTFNADACTLLRFDLEERTLERIRPVPYVTHTYSHAGFAFWTSRLALWASDLHGGRARKVFEIEPPTGGFTRIAADGDKVFLSTGQTSDTFQHESQIYRLRLEVFPSEP